MDGFSCDLEVKLFVVIGIEDDRVGISIGIEQAFGKTPFGIVDQTALAILTFLDREELDVAGILLFRGLFLKPEQYR